MADELTKSDLLYKELEEIQVSMQSSIQTLKDLQGVQRNFIQLAQTYEQMRTFLLTAVPQFEQEQKNLVQLTKNFETHQKQLNTTAAELIQKQRSLEDDIRSNHENRWKQSRQELIQTQNEVLKASQNQQLQINAFIKESNQTQQQLAGELRSKLENQWNQSRQEMVQLQNDLLRASKVSQEQIKDLIAQVSQKQVEVEHYLKNDHINRWKQAEEQLLGLTKSDLTLQHQADKLSTEQTKLHNEWQTSDIRNRRQIRLLILVTGLSCMLTLTLLGTTLYPYYQYYFTTLLNLISSSR